MQRFLLLRVFYAGCSLLFISMLLFGVVRLAGDPILAFLPPDATQEDYERTSAFYGLDKPIYIQYGVFISKAVRGDFGVSIENNRPVMDLIKQRLPKSLQLVVPSFFLALIVAIPLGAMAAVKKGKPIDTFARVLAGLGQSLPVFWLGLMLVELFVVILGVLPASGMGGWKHYILPFGVLIFFHLPGPIRLVRSSMLEALDSEYIRLVRIKGVSERVVIWKHALRNSIIPVLTFGAMYLAIGITSAIVTETVFAWPGMGRLVYIAILESDYPVIQAVVILTVATVIVANLVTDILYGYVDPRIRIRG